MHMQFCGQSLEEIAQGSERLEALRREDLRIGDIVFVKTRNSVYHILVKDERTYEVSGGWFDQQGVAPASTTIAGCTWGGSIIKVDVVAAVGLSIEFGNRVTTSPVRRMFLLREGNNN